jgi:hypothetical protein
MSSSFETILGLVIVFGFLYLIYWSVGFLFGKRFGILLLAGMAVVTGGIGILATLAYPTNLNGLILIPIGGTLIYFWYLVGIKDNK